MLYNSNNLLYVVGHIPTDPKVISILALIGVIICLPSIVITGFILLIKKKDYSELQNKNFFNSLFMVRGRTIMNFVIFFLLIIFIGIPTYKSEIIRLQNIDTVAANNTKFNADNNTLSSDMESIISTMNGSSKEIIEEFAKSYLEERGYTDVSAHAEFYYTYSSSKYDCKVHIEFTDKNRHWIVRDLSRIMPIK